MKTMGTLGCLVAVGLLAGCGGTTIDGQAWQSALTAQDVEVADWAQYQDAWAKTCEADDDVFSGFVAQELDAGTERGVLRTNVLYACPEREDELDEVFADLASVDDACSTPVDARTKEQALMAEAMGC